LHLRRHRFRRTLRSPQRLVQNRSIALFWVWVYTSFGIEAMLISDVGPLRAIYNSVHIVRHNPLSVPVLLLLSMVIESGLAVVWRARATNYLRMVVPSAVAPIFRAA